MQNLTFADDSSSAWRTMALEGAFQFHGDPDFDSIKLVSTRFSRDTSRTLSVYQVSGKIVYHYAWLRWSQGVTQFFVPIFKES